MISHKIKVGMMCIQLFHGPNSNLYLKPTLGRRFESCLALQQHASVAQLIRARVRKMDRVLWRVSSTAEQRNHNPRMGFRLPHSLPPALTANLSKLNLKFQIKCVELWVHQPIGRVAVLRSPMLGVRIPLYPPNLWARNGIDWQNGRVPACR